LRLLYGEGALIAILAPIVVFLLGLIGSVFNMFFLIFILLGAWTLFYSFLFLDQNQRMYYLSWGLILAGISAAFITRIQYAIALIIAAIVAAILINAATRRDNRKTNVVGMKT
jgi:4-amino-4-deoxy-L-arabinose transferase-like glycosyltransferase